MEKEIVVVKDNGRVVVRNVPPRQNTYGYISRVYYVTREYVVDGKTRFDIRQEEGDPIYLHEIADKAVHFAAMQVALAQNYLSEVLPKKPDFTHEKYK